MKRKVYKPRNGGIYKKYRKYAGAAAGGILGYAIGDTYGAIAGAKLGYKLSTYRNKKSIAFDGTTGQRDDKIGYRKKSMPKGKRKQWKKFVNKVAAVTLKDRGIQILKMRFQQNTAVGINSQAVAFAHIYGQGFTASAGTEAGHRDLNRIAQLANTRSEDYVKNVGGNANPEIQDKGRANIRMQSAVLEITITNTGAYTMIFDIYHIWYKKNNTAPSATDGLSWALSQSVPLQDGSSSAVTNLTPVNNLGYYGTTLFDMPTFLSKIGATVKSMRQVQITPNGVHTMQIRDPKNYNINLWSKIQQDGVNYGGYVDPKLTESYFVVGRNPVIDGTTAFNIKIDRTYRFTVEGIRTVQTSTIDYQ